MGIKTTLFAAFAVIVFAIRNYKVSKILNKKSGKYDDLMPLFNQYKNLISKIFLRLKKKGNKRKNQENEEEIINNEKM